MATLAHEIESALVRVDNLRATLQSCSEALVKHLDAAFARIWTLDEGGSVLELEASAGMYTHIDGGHARIPVGQFKIGRIAEERRPHLTNSVQSDESISNPEWARETGMMAFAGYPLIVHDRLVGVMAIFARHSLNDSVLNAMASIANQIALGIGMKRAGAALIESEDRYRTLVESARDLITTLSVDGTIASLNPAFETVYGWSPKEWIGKGVAPIVHAEDLPRTIKAIETVLRGDHMPVYEIRLLHKSGRYIDTEFMATPIKKNGRVVGALGIARDVSERKRSKRDLQDSRRQMEAFLENSPTVIWMVGEDGKVVLGNKLMEELVDLPMNEILGKTTAELFPKAAARAMEATIQQVRHERRAVEAEHSITTAEGNRVYHTIEFPVFDNQGNMHGVGGISTEVTDRVAAQQYKEELEKQLHQAQKLESVGQLAGGIAHDFNNILAVILSYAEFVQEELPDGSPIKDDVREIQTAAQRAADLVHRLLVFSRRDLMRSELVDINAQVAETKSVLARTIGEHIELRMKLGEDMPPIESDPNYLEQIILNLSVNARDAMPRGGVLAMETSKVVLDDVYAEQHPDARRGEFVCLSVSDSGHGMTKEVMNRAFEPFFTTKDKASGTGLGLASVYGIVRGSGGHVVLYSEVERGTTVKVYLPAAGKDQGNGTRKASETQAPQGRGETILVVEDEHAVRELTCRILSAHGYKVIQAGDPARARVLCGEHQGIIEMVLTDVVMPGISGLELSNQLREIYPDLKRLYMSGYTQDIVSQQGPLDAPVISKPFTQAQLLDTVRAVLDDGENGEAGH